jgi:hypothetical protein
VANPREVLLTLSIENARVRGDCQPLQQLDILRSLRHNVVTHLLNWWVESLQLQDSQQLHWKGPGPNRATLEEMYKLKYKLDKRRINSKLMT